MRRENRNAPEGIEGEKVTVTSDDVGRMAAQCEFEKLVVLGIAASRYSYIYIDPLSLARQSGEKATNVFLIDISAELLSAQDLVEFGERCKRKEDFSFPEHQIKSLAGF